MKINAKDLTVNKNELNNWVFIGRGYDILKMNPRNLIEEVSFRNVFDLKATDDPIPGTNGLTKPPEVLYSPEPGGITASTTEELFSSYDVQQNFKLAANVALSDVTGQLFSFSLSSSFEKENREIGQQEQVKTFTEQRVTFYKLKLDDSKQKQVDPYFISLVENLPGSVSTLIEEFGTHYASEVSLGGQAYQKLAFNKEEYVTMKDNKINVKSEASMAFKIVKSNTSIETATGLHEEFRNKILNKAEEITYSGGETLDFNSWSNTVRNSPVPIRVKLVPLYELVNKDYFLTLPDIEGKYQKLKEQIDQYIQTGVNPSQCRIRYGDELQLSIVAERGEKRYLSIENDVHYTVTKADTPGISGAQLPTAKWQILPVDAKDMGEIVKVGDVVLLKRGSSEKYLDAQSGRDDEYYPGDGLTSADESHAQQEESVKWKVELAYETDRKEIVEGDFVKFQTLWQNSDNEYGYLQGEFDSKEPKQRVFSFGNGRRDNGSNWKITRTS